MMQVFVLDVEAVSSLVVPVNGADYWKISACLHLRLAVHFKPLFTKKRTYLST